MPPFSIERAALSVRSKKGKLSRHQDRGFALAATGFGGSLAVIDQGNTAAALQVIESGWYVPAIPPDYDALMARFLLKVGLELLFVGGFDVCDQQYDLARRCARYGELMNEWDIAYGIYPRRADLHISRHWDCLGPIDTHQLYQYEIGAMTSGDMIFCLIYAQNVMAVNLTRPPATEYILCFNARNEFGLRSRWSYDSNQSLSQNKR